MRIAAILVAGLVGLTALTGCSRAPQSLSLFDEVRQKHFQTGQPGQPGLTFERAPEAVTVTAAHERRPAVLTTVDTWTWHGRIPERAELFGGVQILPEGWAVVRGFEAKVTLRSGRTSEVLAVARASAGKDGQDPQRWVDFSTDLADWAGREVTLEFSARLDGLPARHRHSNVVAWAPVRLAAAGSPRKRPNILFIVVDTLRADHTTPYGYKRETTPNLQRLLAAPGVVAENAYSQAPWTLPSVTSFLTGRYPGELLGDNFAAYGIPAEVQPLAERMSALGYQTGGFYANRTLHSGNGFDRGFDTFYSPPAPVTGPAGITTAPEPDAAGLNARALPWLGAHRRDPFFLYVHYIDPHDPYVNPEIVDNRTPFYPEYRGRVAGTWIHGIYNGRLKLEDPERDVAQVVALYDTEIHYADRFVGELIEAIPSDVLEDTLIVLTADHGEELYDHGGWKHGFTLYDEQIHVPLLVRWDGHLPAGRRLPGTVRLLDLVPTLLDAVGEKPDPALPGVSLLPALAGQAALPRLSAFAQHMMTGPLRAAVVLDRKKLILFNHRTPFAPADGLQEYLWRLDLGRLQRVELYDLGKDPGERANRAGAAADPQTPEDLRRLEPLIHRQLDRERPGLRLIASGLPAGSRLRGSAVFDRPLAGWQPYFLADGDRVELNGNRLDFDLGGDVIQKGVLIQGEGLTLTGLRAEGEVVLQIGAGRPYAGGVAGWKALAAPDWPAPPSGPALRLWRSPSAEEAGSRSQKGSEETERRLRALGYIQ